MKYFWAWVMIFAALVAAWVAFLIFVVFPFLFMIGVI